MLTLITTGGAFVLVEFTPVAIVLASECRAVLLLFTAQHCSRAVKSCFYFFIFFPGFKQLTLMHAAVNVYPLQRTGFFWTSCAAKANVLLWNKNFLRHTYKINYGQLSKPAKRRRGKPSTSPQGRPRSSQLRCWFPINVFATTTYTS